MATSKGFFTATSKGSFTWGLFIPLCCTDLFHIVLTFDWWLPFPPFVRQCVFGGNSVHALKPALSGAFQESFLDYFLFSPVNGRSGQSKEFLCFKVGNFENTLRLIHNALLGCRFEIFKFTQKKEPECICRETVESRALLHLGISTGEAVILRVNVFPVAKVFWFCQIVPPLLGLAGSSTGVCRAFFPSVPRPTPARFI